MPRPVLGQTIVRSGIRIRRTWDGRHGRTDPSGDLARPVRASTANISGPQNSGSLCQSSDCVSAISSQQGGPVNAPVHAQLPSSNRAARRNASSARGLAGHLTRQGGRILVGIGAASLACVAAFSSAPAYANTAGADQAHHTPVKIHLSAAEAAVWRRDVSTAAGRERIVSAVRSTSVGRAS